MRRELSSTPLTTNGSNHTIFFHLNGSTAQGQSKLLAARERKRETRSQAATADRVLS